MPRVAASLKKYRLENNLSQRQMAAKLDTTHGVVNDMEHEKPRSRRVAIIVLGLVEV